MEALGLVVYTVNIAIEDGLTAHLKCPAKDEKAAHEWGAAMQPELERLVREARKSESLKAYGKTADSRWLGFEGDRSQGDRPALV